MITDYESLLRVTEDGHIWWLLKDAIRLGAGFLPVCDDHQTLEIELRAPNNLALVNERTLISSFDHDRLSIERPMTFDRGGFRYVDAGGFLDWLSQYIAQTQAKITFPNELASEVRKTKAKAAASQPPVASQKFASLTLAFAGWFDKNLDDLPFPLRQRVEQEFFPIPWDNLSAAQRRSVALQWDYQHDPATEQDRKFWWDFFVRMHELQAEIAEWKSAATPTASDISLQESRLKELQQEIDRMEFQQRQARGDYYPERKSLDADKVSTPTTTDYIAYPKALKILRERWTATPEELAVWIFLGPDTGGIAAYRNANELNPPPRFYFDYFMGEDYLSPLMACWFRQDDIDRFDPADRYITGTALIERWSNQPGLRTEAFIRAKIAESRLLDIHPTFGVTRETFNDDTSFPPLSAGLFAMSQIKRIESEDALDSAPVLPTSDAEPEPIRDGAPKKGGRPKGLLAEAVEMAYLHFHAAGNVDILKPGNARSFLKSFSKLVKNEVPLVEFGNRNIADDIGERIKDVKIPYGGKCSVTTQDRKNGNKTEHGMSYNQYAIAKLLTALRKKYPILS